MIDHIFAEDGGAEVDFIGRGVSVRICIRNGKLEVTAKMSHGEDASTWDLHEAEWPLPEK